MLVIAFMAVELKCIDQRIRLIEAKEKILLLTVNLDTERDKDLLPGLEPLPLSPELREVVTRLKLKQYERRD